MELALRYLHAISMMSVSYMIIRFVAEEGPLR
jgi:hypothetical protein